MRCLIVDDDESPRRLMTRLVERSGHSAMAVHNGLDATAAATARPFDIAIVDLEMPGQSGAETIALLRNVQPNLRVLVVSGYDDRRHVLDALAAGADGYLLKDEVGESLGDSLQSVRAGHTPLSPRIAAIMLRQLRRKLDRPPVVAGSTRPPLPRARVGSGSATELDTLSREQPRRSSSDSASSRSIARVELRRSRPLAEGTGSTTCLTDKKPVPE